MGVARVDRQVESVPRGAGLSSWSNRTISRAQGDDPHPVAQHPVHPWLDLVGDQVYAQQEVGGGGGVVRTCGGHRLGLDDVQAATALLGAVPGPTIRPDHQRTSGQIGLPQHTIGQLDAAIEEPDAPVIEEVGGVVRVGPRRELDGAKVVPVGAISRDHAGLAVAVLPRDPELDPGQGRGFTSWVRTPRGRSHVQECDHSPRDRYRAGSVGWPRSGQRVGGVKRPAIRADSTAGGTRDCDGRARRPLGEAAARDERHQRSSETQQAIIDIIADRLRSGA